MAVLWKTNSDIEMLRVSGQQAADVPRMIGKHVRAGVTTGELDLICNRFIVDELKAIPANVGYMGFEKTLCTSVNHVVCHGIPDARRLKNGDIINVDVGIIKNGYFGDTSRMFIVGEGSIQAKRLVQTTFDCMWLGIKQVRPGAYLGDIGHAIQKHAESNGYSVVREYCGHGIGRSYHEDPQVSHYGRPGTGLRLESGMVFTIEPMVNVGRAETKQSNDGWTVTTKDRSLSAQWEHMVAVTDDGYEVLTSWEED
jgi:methionyl aminopeptidase